MNTSKLLTELDDLGFPMLADWMRDGEINLKKSLQHLDENKCMMDDEEDEKAFKRAEEIVRMIY